MGVRVVNKLHDVKEKRIPAAYKWKPILKAVQTQIKKDTGADIELLPTPTFVHEYRGETLYGIGFSLSKGKFMQIVNSNGDFRYKHKEAVQALKQVISQFPELAQKIYWDRGFGVFVYNLYFK